MKIKKLIPYIVISLILISAVIAIQPNPEVYWGYVYLEQDLAKEGDILTVETQTGEILATQKLPYNVGDSGSYSFNIVFDDPLTPIDEGASPNEKLIWRLDGITVLEPINDFAEPEKTNNNFDIISYENPELTVEISTESEDIKPNQETELTLSIENKGQGTALINIELLSDSLLSQIPTNITLSKQNSTTVKIPVTLTTCGDYNIDVVVNYYSIANILVDTIKKPVKFTSKAHDIELTSIEISDLNPEENNPISISAVISNIGSYDVNNFEILFYDQSIGGNIIQRINSNLTLKKDQKTTVQFNWEPPLGTYNIHGIVDIDEAECNFDNNIQNSNTITAKSNQPEKEIQQTQTIIHGSGQECILHNVELSTQGTAVQLQPNCDILSFEYKNRNYNITLLEVLEDSVKILITSPGYLEHETTIENTEIKEIDLSFDNSFEVYISIVELSENPTIKIGLTRLPQITGLITKEPEKTMPLIAIIMMVVIIAILAFYIKKGTIKLPKFRIEKQLKQEETEKIKQEEIQEIQKELTEETKPISLENQTKVKILRQPKQKPKFKSMINDIKLPKKIPKIDPGLSEEEKKLPQVPYEYLSEAIELIEKIRKNLKPRDELVEQYKEKYPKFLIDLVAKNMFTYSEFRGNIDVVHELENLKVLDKEYKFISINKLSRAIEILAKGYAAKTNKEKINNLRGGLLDI